MPDEKFATSGCDLIGRTIDDGRLEFLSILGVGAYGVVYLAIDRHHSVLFPHKPPVYLAVKCLSSVGLDARQRHFQRREIALHQLASAHPHVVTVHKVIEDGEYVYAIMDFYDQGDLFSMITERQRYIGNDELIRSVFLQIVDAVQYCHKLGIFHRDLKPENILCTRQGEAVCIADFGLATTERTSTDFGCGSTFYLSPECQGGLFEPLANYSTEHNDIWSLGVILVNLTCGRNPWRQACPSDETFRAYVDNPDFLRTILPISFETNAILRGLFALDPQDRISLADLRRHVLAVESFTMSTEELRHAHAAARAAAALARPNEPLPTPVSTPPTSYCCTPPTPAQVSAQNPTPNPRFPSPLPHHPQLIHYSSAPSGSNLIAATATPHHHAPPVLPLPVVVTDGDDSGGGVQQQALGVPPHPLMNLPALHPFAHGPVSVSAATAAGTPLVVGDCDGVSVSVVDVSSSSSMVMAMDCRSANSSSSGLSLPPTPEFAPIDIQISHWDTLSKSSATMFHHQPPPPTPPPPPPAQIYQQHQHHQHQLQHQQPPYHHDPQPVPTQRQQGHAQAHAHAQAHTYQHTHQHTYQQPLSHPHLVPVPVQHFVL